MTTLDVYKNWLGIPDEAGRPPGHYELLRLVKFEDNADKIRANYKKLNAHVRKYASGQYSLRSQELLNELAKAMICLTDPAAKREYDESLGRAPERKTGPSGPRTIGTILSERQVISRPQLKEAENFAEARGLSLRDAIVQMKLVDAPTAAQALAEELGRSYIDVSDIVPEDAVLDKLPRNTVKRHSILPLFIDEDTLIVACANEPSHQLEEELRLRFGLAVRPVIATPSAINQGIAKYYAPGLREESEVDEAIGQEGGKKGKAKGGRKKKVPFSKLSADEQQLRTQVGYLIICWSLIGPILIDQFILSGPATPIITVRHFHQLNFFPFSWFFLTLFVPWPIIFWVVNFFWK